MMAEKEEMVEVDVIQDDDNEVTTAKEIENDTAMSPTAEEDIKKTPNREEELRKELEKLAEKDVNELIELYIKLYKELEETKALRDEYLDTAQRVQASFENYKKQVDKNIAWSNFHNKSKILTKFLTIYDDLERTLESFNKHPDVDTAKEAIEMVLRNMRSTLESLDLTLIEPKKERFDPQYHEAIHVVETTEEEDNTIIEVVSKGFKLENTVIRPAKVVVARNPKQKRNEENNR